MGKEIRTVRYDAELQVEAYHFQGVVQHFPNHFHEYYVIGCLESGRRHISCNTEEYTAEPGDLVLFNPRDSHTCGQIDAKPMEYRCVNIQPGVMGKAVLEITGREYRPYFTPQVVFHSELVPVLRELHLMIMEAETDFKKEESFFFLLEQLIEECTEREPQEKLEQSPNTKAVCGFLEENYMKSITLDDLCGLTGMSKYYLLRTFTKEKGISPYRYLETIRIDRAKRMLEQGIMPVDVAMQTGFADQSHFTNFFKKFIGLTPKQYMNIFKDTSR